VHQLIASVLAQQVNRSAIGGGAFICAFGLIGLALLAFWIWSIVDAVKNPKLDSNTRLIWVIVIVIVGPLGSLIYLFAGR
jgi:hypothetical protein